MAEQKIHYPVSLDTAELIVSLASKKQNAFKLMMSVLREIEEEIEMRRKINMKFYQVSSIVEGIYNKEIYTHRQLSSRTTGEIKLAEDDIYQLNNQREKLKQELEIHEQELNEVRQYAEQRRDKKAMREKQYHNFYKVPIVASQYKKKYVRARDKNLDAEEQMSAIRATVDSSQKAISETSKSITDSQQKIESLRKQKDNAESISKNAEDMVAEIRAGQNFWSSFDKNQLSTAIQATQHFIETIQKYVRKNMASFNQIVHYESDFVKVFRLALSEYSEAEKYAESRWGKIQVEFDCAKCTSTQVGWPNLDKVRTTDLLCDACYKETRTAMILEKKFNGMLGAGRSSHLQQLPGESSISVPSIATSNTSHSSNKSKNGLKMMFQKITKNKRPSSTASTTATNQTFTKNSPDLYVS